MKLLSLLFLPCYLSILLDNLKSIDITNNIISIKTEKDQSVKLSWLENNIIRYQAINGGQFQDPGIVLPVSFQAPTLTVVKGKDEVTITNELNYKLSINYKPIKMSLYKDNTILFGELQPININNQNTIQSLKYDSNELFFGGGMQNGRFNHKDSTINITVSYNWNDGGNPNPAPFIMSNKGYGIYRNTFQPGQYKFNNPIQLIHNEARFDSYYFLGDYKMILNKYTYLTGRPFMPPIYGLELGDSDCYYKRDGGRPPKDTLIDSTKVAEGYVQNDMPRGWMLVNDGYGCGYTKLAETNESLSKKNISLGLWTESDLTNQPTEVGKWGVRVRKLDVKWVGKGYKFAFDACNIAYNGIENYSNARGFVWLVEGWSGVQKCGVQWTGDQSGSWENIRFHIPTIHGSGLSSQVYTAGDIDGIFDGSPNTYIRDLQFKVFTPVLMTMSGWAKADKQPWRYGEPGTSINRNYLKLREQLMPYIYTLANQAYQTGFPIVRSMLLEFPNDPKTWDKETTKYQYMFGSSFLVAPVYKNELKRDGIYLPKGKWVDYWNGKVYSGPTTLDNYSAPLDILPLFVKGNSIIPMWPSINSYKERIPSDAIILDIYANEIGNNEFNLYEDDLVTREYKNQKYTNQLFNLLVESNNLLIKVNPIIGTYNNSPIKRNYQLRIHTSKPNSVTFSPNSNEHQWSYNPNDKSGILTVLLNNVNKDSKIEVNVRL